MRNKNAVTIKSMEGNVSSSMSSDTVFVKDEPLWEQVTDSQGVGEAPARVSTDHEVKQEPEHPDSVCTTHVHVKEEVVKCLKEEEWEDKALYGVSESRALGDLYAGHEVKDELVLGPEGLQPADIVFTLYAAQALNAKEQPVVKDCVVRLERIDFRHVHNDSKQGKKHSNTNLNTEKQFFVCDICNKKFTLKTQIMEHVMIHIHQRSQEESMRDVADNERTRQKCHRIRSKSNKNRVVVGGNLKNEGMETAGEQTTSVLRQVCSDKDAGEISVLKHLKTTKRSKKGATPYKCGWCEYACNQKYHLIVHERKHTGERPYKCSHCSYSSALKHNLVKHERIHTGEKPYKCNLCSYASAHRYHLLNHERKHTGEKLYKCSHCSYTAIRKSYLLVHEIKHTGEKPYKCSYCSYATIHKNYLQVHAKIHTGEKLYQCSHCSYASDRKNNLLVHEKIHTGEKPYKCSSCSYACNRKNHLRSHEKIHTGEKPYKCSNCSYASAHKAALRVHERRHRLETLQM